MLSIVDTVDSNRSDTHALAYMLNTEPSFFDHFDDLVHDARTEITDCLFMHNCSDTRLAVDGCPGKLDHNTAHGFFENIL